MPPENGLKSFKRNMKIQTSRIINLLPLTTEQANILKNDAHDLLNEGENEKSITKDLGIHAGQNSYTPYNPYEKKQDILHPPLEVHIKMAKNTQKKW